MGFPRSNGALVDTDYAQGTRVVEGVNEYVTAKAHGTLAVGDVVVISYDEDGPETAAAATSTVYQQVGVVCTAATVGLEVLLQTRGFAEAYVEGTTDVAAGDFLEVLNGENELKKDGTRSANSVAVAVDAQAENKNVLSTVFMLGERALIAAS